MKLDCFSFYKFRLESLNTKSVKEGWMSKCIIGTVIDTPPRILWTRFSLTYKNEFPILPLTKRKFLSKKYFLQNIALEENARLQKAINYVLSLYKRDMDDENVEFAGEQADV